MEWTERFEHSVKSGDLLNAILAAHIIDLNSVYENLNGMTPLGFAISHNMSAIVSTLIEHGALVSLIDSTGYTPLHIASRDKHISLVEELINAGAKVNSKCPVGWTPLHVATWWNRVDVVEILLKSGADSSISNHEGYTPREIAAEEGYRKILHILT